MNRNWILLAALACTTAVAADNTMKPYSKQVPVGAQDRVTITNVAGSVTITTWDRKEVDIQGELASGIEGVEVNQSDGGVEIRVQVNEDLWKKNSWRDDSWERSKANLRVRVPATVQLEANTVSASLNVNGMRGKSRLKTVSGDLRSDVVGTDLEARSVSGDVELTGNGGKSRLRANSVSGEVVLTNVGGEIEAKSVSGDVEILLQAAEDVRSTSVSGDVEIRGSLASQGELEAQAVSGRVKVIATAPAGYRYEARTYSGRIRSCLGGEVEPRKGNSGGRTSGTSGQGSGTVRLKSHSGGIEICDR